MPQLSLEDLELFAQGQPVPVRETPAISAAESRGRSYQAPQQWRQQLALDDLEDRENLPRGLLTAVLTRESNGYPTARSKAGAQGLFQFMPATAQAYKIDPTNPAQAADAAAKELGSHYKRYGGNLQQTLAAWNWGSGNLQQQGMANAPKETRNFITWVTGLLTPASAEAATGPAQRLTLDALEQRFGAQQPAGGTTTPAPVSQAAPTTAPPAGAASGPSAADEQYAAQTIARMRQHQPRTVVTDPAALLATGGGPAQPQPAPAPVTDPAALLAVGGGGAPVPQTREQQLLAEARASQARGERPPIAQAQPPGVPTVEQETLEEGVTAPSTLIPLAIGGVAGSAARAAGQAAMPYVAPWLGRAAGAVPTLAEAAGNYAGRWLNVQLGYEEPGTAGDVLAVALPVGARAVGAAGRAVTRNLPGAGVVRHELGEEALHGLGTRLQPRTDADTLFAQAATHNPDIATPDLWRTTGQIIRRERGFGPATRATQSLGVAQEVLDRMRASGGPLALQELEAYRQRIGALIGTTTGQEQANLRQIYAGLMRDLESAAARNVPGAEILRGALQTRRLEHGLETLTDLWSPGKGIQLEQGDITRVYGKRILTQFQKRLHDDPLFAGSFTPAELTDIQGTLRDVARITARSPVAAPGGLLKHALSASLGTATGITTGPLAGLTTAAVVEAAPRVLAAAMRSAPGRAAIRRALDAGGGRFTAAGLGMISEAIREAASGEPTTSGPPGGPPPSR